MNRPAQGQVDSGDRAGPQRDDHWVLTSDPLAQALVAANPEFSVLDKLGSGAQANVYLVFEANTKRSLAVKVLKDRHSESGQHRRLQREIQLTSRIRHPNIITVHHLGFAAGRPYIVMDCVSGLPIDAYVDEYALSHKTVALLFAKVCAALHAAHTADVIHRDLKPENILCDLATGEPYVLDFGLAKDHLEGAGRYQRHLSLDGQIIGTLPYLSPEQTLGGRLGPGCDIYAIGVVMHLILTGDFPYAVHGPPARVISRILHDQPPRPMVSAGNEQNAATPVDPDLQSIVLKALEKEPEDRYGSAREMAEDLQRYVRGEAVSARSSDAFYVLKRKLREYRRKRKRDLALIVLLIAALTAAVSLWYRSQRTTRLAMTALQMNSLVQLASVERDAGRLDTAKELLLQAATFGDAISSADTMINRQRFEVAYRMGDIHATSTKPADAAPWCDKALAIAESMADGQTPYWQRQLAYAVMLQGKLLNATQQFEEADAALARADMLFGALLAEDPENESLRSDYALTLGLRGKTSRMLDRLDQALQQYTQSYELYASVAAPRPDSAKRQLDLIRATNKLAVAHIVRQTPADDHCALTLLTDASRGIASVLELPDAEQHAWSISGLQSALKTNTGIVRNRISMRSE